MADNDKPLLDFSSLPALAGSAKDAVVKGGKAVVEGVGKGYDAVANTTQDAIDTTKATITGSIELPEGSKVEADFMKEFGPLLSAEEVAKIKAEGIVSAEMIQNKLIPRLMAIDSQAKLQKLRTTFQTHRQLSNLIEVYGFAPIEKGARIPQSEVNTSQILREAKLAGKIGWSEMVQSGRAYFKVNEEVDDLAVGRRVIALRARALLEAMNSIYGNNSLDNEHFTNKGMLFDTDGAWKETWLGNDLAEVLGTGGSDRWGKISGMTPKYGRSTINNDYILKYIEASTDPKIDKITIAGVEIPLRPVDGSEAKKLELIADDLEAMREGIEKADKGLFRTLWAGTYEVTKAGEAVIHTVAGVIYIPVGLINTLGVIPAWLMLSAIGAGMSGGYPSWANRGIFMKTLMAPGRLAAWGVKSVAGVKTYANDEERANAKALAPDPKGDFKKFVDTKRDELRAEHERLTRLGQTVDSRNIERRLSELDKYYADYETRYATGNLRRTDRPNTIKAEIENIAQGKGRRLSAMAGDLMKGNFTGATDRVRAHVKSFGTAEGYAAAQTSFEAAIKGTKADLRTVTVGGEVLHYEIINKSLHSSVYEKVAQDLEKFEKYQKWKAIYEVYETRRVALARAEWQVHYITEALKAGAGSTATPGGIGRMVSISAEGQAAAEKNREQAQQRVEASVEAMSNLKTGFETGKLTVTVDASGNVTANNEDVIKAFEKKLKAVVKSIEAGFGTLGIKPGEIDISLRGAEENKTSVLERIGKKATVAAKK